MRKYETLYVMRPDLEAEKTQELIERYKGVIANQGAEVNEVNEWGKRRLAYEIDGQREGYYVLMKFQSATEVSRELERLFKISDDVIRYITVRVEE